MHRRARTWLARVDSVLGAGRSISARASIEQLPQLQRAVALSAVALAEHTPVVMLDLLDAFADPSDEAGFLVALDRLAPATTTILLGSPVSTKTARDASLSREIVQLDLDQLATPPLERKDATPVSQSVFSPTRRGWLRYAALAAVVLVPLAFAGLFIGAVSQISHSISDIPAAIVNNDQVVTQTGANGKTTQVLAGRELVTELTGKKSAGFTWTITNSKDAKADLANGTVYAILTVPKNFSKSIVSLSSKSPIKANLTITTDDSHNYLTGSVAQVVGTSLSSEFGQAVTKQYIAGLYSGIGGFGSSLTTAASGATKLSGGASSLSTGLSSYVAGVSAIPSGLRQLQAGIETAKSGVESRAIAPYTSSVSGETAKLNADVAALAANPSDPTLLAAVQTDSATLTAIAASGSTVATGVSSAFDTLASNTGSFARQTEALATGGAQLTTGAQSLASGASSLAAGLTSGAAKTPSYTSAQVAQTASVASNPVGVSVDRKHEVSSAAQIIATLFVPLGLWIGSLAVFLVLRPLTRRTLSSTAGNGRLVLSSIARASVVTAAQALLLVLLAAHGGRGELDPAAGDHPVLARHGDRVHRVPLPAHHRPGPRGARRLHLPACRADHLHRRPVPDPVARETVPVSQPAAAPHLRSARDGGDHLQLGRRHRHRSRRGPRRLRCGKPAYRPGRGASCAPCPRPRPGAGECVVEPCDDFAAIASRANSSVSPSTARRSSVLRAR